MRRFLQSCPRWLQAGWLLPLVMLALPNCILNGSPFPEDPPAFDPGPVPQTSAVMCDIPKYKPFNADEDCATDKDVESIQAMSRAAIGLAEGVSTDSLALDYSADSTMRCGGKPKKITFHGPFPDRLHDLLELLHRSAREKYADPTAVCVAKCIDLTNEGAHAGGRRAEVLRGERESRHELHGHLLQGCVLQRHAALGGLRRSAATPGTRRVGRRSE